MAEKPCGATHASLGEAIRHAEELLRFPGRWRLHSQRLNVGAEYCFGTMNHNDGTVIGRQMGPRLRWRLDFDPVKGAHVNAEDARTKQKTLHPIQDLRADWVHLSWTKWTKQTSPIDRVIQKAAYDFLRQRRSNPRLTILEVCRNLGTMHPEKLGPHVQAYITKYDYLPAMF